MLATVHAGLLRRGIVGLAQHLQSRDSQGMIDFVPHRAAWTPEKSARFRSQLVSPGRGREELRVSSSVVRFARANGADVSGQVLEIRSQSNRLAGALGADAYESAFVVDAVENLLDDELRPLIAELHRALRPGGSLVVIAPNAEKLKIGETVCPDCGCMFHRLEHVRSWTAESLAAFLSECGFDRVVAVPWYLEERWWKSRLITLAARALGKRLPHLVYVGRKRVIH
jgi:SAM-dependent methyltransferase